MKHKGSRDNRAESGERSRFAGQNWEVLLKAFALAVVAALVLSVGVSTLLSRDQNYAYQTFATTGARVTPSDNLVGRDWSGLAKPGQEGGPGASTDRAQRVR